MKGIEIRELNTDELIIKEKELKQELFNLRFQKATGQLNNTAIIGKVKKDLARVKTIAREMHILKKIERG